MFRLLAQHRAFGLAVMFVAGSLITTASCESPSTNPSHSPDAQRAVAVAYAFLEAISRSDTVALRLHGLPSLRLVALADNPETPPRVTLMDDFVAQIQADSGQFEERMWEPQVHVDDRLATVWAPYDFYRAEQFSHCGVDSFDLVRMGSTWKVVSIAYTVHPEGCEASPLGVPTFD